MSNPIILARTCAAWDSAGLSSVFNEELKTLSIQQLPLQKGLSYSSMALIEKLSVSILKREQQGSFYTILAGLFYTGIIAGCNCADDPSPQDEVNEYCEVLFSIDPETGITTVELCT